MLSAASHFFYKRSGSVDTGYSACKTDRIVDETEMITTEILKNSTENVSHIIAADKVAYSTENIRHW